LNTPKGKSRLIKFSSAIKRVIGASINGPLPREINKLRSGFKLFERLVDIARTNTANDGVMERMNTALGREESLSGQRDLMQILQSVNIMLNPARPKITEAIARKALSKRGENFAPSLFLGKKFQYYRARNQAEIARLGLLDGETSSVVAALERIASSSKSQNHRRVAKLLLQNPELLAEIDFSIYDVPDGHAGRHTVFDDGSQMVSINISGFYGQGVESVLLHEYLHAFTANLIAKPESELTSQQRSAKRRLERLYKLAAKTRTSDSAGIEFDNAMTSLDEFVATFFSKDPQRLSASRLCKKHLPKNG
jgi:hypothetical protein